MSIIKSINDDDYLTLSDDTDIKQMVEFLMRETLNIDTIFNEPILSNIDKQIIENHYFNILADCIAKEKKRQISDFKKFVFEVIKREKPTSEEQIIYLIDGYIREMPMLFQISTAEVLSIWEMKYKEPNTELEMTFREWASLYTNHNENE